MNYLQFNTQTGIGDMIRFDWKGTDSISKKKTLLSSRLSNFDVKHMPFPPATPTFISSTGLQRNTENAFLQLLKMLKKTGFQGILLVITPQIMKVNQ